MIPDHKSEFPDVQVHEDIRRMVAVGTLIDVSWKNDAGPSFIRQWDRARWFDDGVFGTPRLWVSPEDVDAYRVTADNRVLYQGGDLALAVGHLMVVGARPLSPRFVLTVGVFFETYPDIPESAPLGIWDRKHKQMAVRFSANYEGMICLERVGDSGPEALTKWLNSLSDAALKSEGIE